MPNDTEFLRYFVSQTDERLKTLVTKIENIETKLIDLSLFKNQVETDAKWKALIVSSITGAIMLTINIGVTIYLAKKG